jgi:hypothetical protein
VLVDVLDGVLDGDDVVLPVRVQVVDHRGLRGRLPGPGRPGDQDQALVALQQPVNRLGDAEHLEAGDDQRK